MSITLITQIQPTGQNIKCSAPYKLIEVQQKVAMSLRRDPESFAQYCQLFYEDSSGVKYEVIDQDTYQQALYEAVEGVATIKAQQIEQNEVIKDQGVDIKALQDLNAQLLHQQQLHIREIDDLRRQNDFLTKQLTFETTKTAQPVLSKYYSDFEVPDNMMAAVREGRKDNVCPRSHNSNVLFSSGCCRKLYCCVEMHNKHENHKWIPNDYYLCLYCRQMQTSVDQCTLCGKFL